MTIFRSKNYELVFDERGHKYRVTINGITTTPPSVTTTLKKHGISSYNTPEQIGDSYMVRGTDIHDYCTAYATGTLKWAMVWCDYVAYIKSFKKWFVDNVGEVIACEIPLYDIDLKYAGKFDLLIRLKSGRVALVEIKTGIMPMWVGLQLAGYGRLVNKHIKIDDYIAIELQKDGVKAKSWIMEHDSIDYAANHNVWLSLFDGKFNYETWKANRNRRHMKVLKGER